MLNYFTKHFFFYFQVTKEELAKLVAGFEKCDLLTGGGVTLAGQRYIYLSGTDRVVRAKLGKVGVHCMKTQQGNYFRKKTNHLKTLEIIESFIFFSCYCINL